MDVGILSEMSVGCGFTFIPNSTFTFISIFPGGFLQWRVLF